MLALGFSMADVAVVEVLVALTDVVSVAPDVRVLEAVAPAAVRTPSATPCVVLLVGGRLAHFAGNWGSTEWGSSFVSGELG